jgi:hypothetical protein
MIARNGENSQFHLYIYVPSLPSLYLVNSCALATAKIHYSDLV